LFSFLPKVVYFIFFNYFDVEGEKRNGYFGIKAKIAAMKATMYFDGRANWFTTRQTEVT